MSDHTRIPLPSGATLIIWHTSGPEQERHLDRILRSADQEGGWGDTRVSTRNPLVTMRSDTDEMKCYFLKIDGEGAEVQTQRPTQTILTLRSCEAATEAALDHMPLFLTPRVQEAVLRIPLIPLRITLPRLDTASHTTAVASGFTLLPKRHYGMIDPHTVTLAEMEVLRQLGATQIIEHERDERQASAVKGVRNRPAQARLEAFLDERRQRSLAVCMAGHRRLGEGSALRGLDESLLQAALLQAQDTPEPTMSRAENEALLRLDHGH
jgi:hypothetical protein